MNVDDIAALEQAQASADHYRISCANLREKLAHKADELELWLGRAHHYRISLDNALALLEKQAAEIAALRGDLPEGWQVRTDQVWLLCSGDEGSVWAPTKPGEKYEWEACRDGEYIDSGTAPTLLEAIAACEAARGAQ